MQRLLQQQRQPGCSATQLRYRQLQLVAHEDDRTADPADPPPWAALLRRQVGTVSGES